MASAGAGDASGSDLALLAHRAADRPEVLVVDDVDLVATERARLEPASAGHALLVTPAVRRPGSTLLCHYLQPTFVCRIVSGRKALESSGGRGTGPAARPHCERLLFPFERGVVVGGAARSRPRGVGGAGGGRGGAPLGGAGGTPAPPARA